MAYASVKLTANSSDYQTQMKSAASAMKNLSSEYSLAATKAKLFGSAADSLKAKAESLSQKVNVQKSIVQMNREEHERLTTRLNDQKTKQEELKTKLEAVKKAYEAEKEATGKNSDATKNLKEELTKLEQEFKANETAMGKTETALSNQSVKLNKAETDLLGMEAELKKVNAELKNHKLNEFAAGCDKAGQKMENFGKRMSVVSAGIAGVAATSVKSFTEMKEGYDIIVTKTGATGDSLEDLKSSADNVFGNMPEDMALIGEAVGEVNTRFHTTGTELEETSKLFIQFASINGTQVTQSVDQVDKIMKAWNIDASQTGNLLGLLTQKAQDTGISVDTLESYVLDNNAAFKEMGLSLPQAINLMAQFDANGVDTTQALAGLKKSLQNATAEGKSLDTALEETIGSIKDAKTDTEALQIATELFGKKGAAEMATAIRENRIDLTSLSASMSEYGSVVETTYNNTKSPMDEAKVAMNNVKLALADMGSTMLTSAAPAINELTSKIKEITQWFMSLDEGQQQTILKIGLFTAAVGPAAIGIGKFAQGISNTIRGGQKFASFVTDIAAKIAAKTAATTAGTVAETAGTAATAAHTAATAAGATAAGGMTAAQKALNLVMSMNPIMKVVTVVSLLVAGFVALYNNSETFRNAVNKLWETVKNAFGKIGETISKITSAATETAKQNLNNMKTAYEENGGGIKGIVAAGWEGIKGAYTLGFDFLDNLTGGKLTEIKNKFLNSEVGQAASKMFNGVKNAASTVMTAAVDTVKENLNNMKTAYEENGGGIKGIVAAGWEGIKGQYTAGLTFVDNLTGGKLTEIKNKFQEKTSEIKADWSEKFANVKETATNFMEEARQSVSEKLNNMKAAYEENGGGIKGIVAASFTGVRDTMGTLMEAANTLTGGKLNSIKESFQSKLELAHSTVSSVMEKIRSKFNEKMETAKNAVSSAINKIKGFFNFSWSLPHIKMPHFSITGSFSLNPPSIPHFSVSWYKTGAIMNSEMIFGMNGSRLLAGGEPETGGEAILPLTPFYTKLNEILDRKLSAIQQAANVYVENHTYIDSEEISSRTVSKVDTEMVNNKRKKR